MSLIRVSKPAPHSAITTSEVRYRFVGIANRNVRQDLDDAIAAGVARTGQRHDDPLEMTELANLYFARAELDGDRRDFDAAEQLARQSLTILPSPNGAALTLAKLANAQHDFRDAIELAHHYQGRNGVAVPMVLATAYLALGDLAQAAAAADEAVRGKPTPSTYLERALVLQGQGRDVEAEADFANAVRVEDVGDIAESARVRALWSRFLVRRGDYPGAKLVIDEALRIAPGNALALSIRAELELRTGNPKPARADLEQAFLAQHQVRYLIDQSRAMEVAGDREGANTLRRQIETIVRDELAQGGFGHRLELVEVLVDRGDPAGFAEAVAIAREELARRPAAETRFQLARALVWTGASDEAELQIRRRSRVARTSSHSTTSSRVAARARARQCVARGALRAARRFARSRARRLAQHRDAAVTRAAIVVVLLLAHAAGAHPLNVGKLRLDARAEPTEIDLSLELDVSVVATVLGTTASPIDAEALAKATYRLEPIASCTWRGATAEVHDRTVTVTDHATCSSELHDLRWRLPFVTHVSPTFQLLVDAHAFDQERVVLLDRSTPALEMIPEDHEAVSLGGFVLKGIAHIGATPSQWHDSTGWKLPDGIDHILFLLGLLLAGGSLLRLIGIASGFTVGHTDTLALATLGVVRPPSSVIEPLIALTIAFVAVEAFTAKFERYRWTIATCFGLIHGFGFANALTELHLSRSHLAKALLGYNLGVELGQVVIVLAIAPIVLLLHRNVRFGRPVIRGAAAAIFVVAMYWFFTRL